VSCPLIAPGYTPQRTLIGQMPDRPCRALAFAPGTPRLTLPSICASPSLSARPHLHAFLPFSPCAALSSASLSIVITEHIQFDVHSLCAQFYRSISQPAASCAYRHSQQLAPAQARCAPLVCLNLTRSARTGAVSDLQPSTAAPVLTKAQDDDLAAKIATF
jgi:hypothetical protein